MMSLGATDSAELAHTVGRATAGEGRAYGVHWTLSPVVDLNLNPNNPITSTRAFGDDPDRAAPLATAMIRGIQAGGMAATAKHFPGDGLDDRDHHLCTTVNPLSMGDWYALSGRMFQEAIDAGVWAIMPGHISLPSWDPGGGSHPADAPPATLSRKLITGLLREKMGFEGVVITDAMNMAGALAWGPTEDILPRAIEAGCDVILFCSAKTDFDILKRAVERGRLTEARIDQSVRRVLALKEALGLHVDPAPRPLTDEDSERFGQAGTTIAETALTVVADREGVLPLKLDASARVLSYRLRSQPERDVTAFDDALRERGVQVTQLCEADKAGVKETFEQGEFDLVIFSAVVLPMWGTGRIRLVGDMGDIWSPVHIPRERLVFVSYGSPYHLSEMSYLPLVINAYSPDDRTQRAVVRLLAGEIRPRGVSPVDLDSPYRYRSTPPNAG